MAEDLSGVAERLRAVLEARRHFLRMWAIDRHLVDPAIDRVARDLEQAAMHPTEEPPAGRPAEGA